MDLNFPVLGFGLGQALGLRGCLDARPAEPACAARSGHVCLR
jgi:hypothetical protein